MNQPLPHYRLFDHTMLTVEQERAMFCAWCAHLNSLRDPDNPANTNGPAITMSEYFERRWDLECWYNGIGMARDAEYMRRTETR